MKKGIALFLWKRKIFVSAILMAILIGVSLYSYEGPEFQNPDKVVAADSANDEDEAPDETDAQEGSFDLEDGVYKGVGTGYGGTITVEVTIKDKQIESITIVSAPGEGESFLNRAKAVIDAMIKNQSMDVDTVSGATYSSRGIIEAVKNALTGEVSTSSVAAGASQGKAPESVGTVDENQTYKDGTYTGSAQGFGGTITVEVTIKNGKIKSVKIISASKETPSYLNKAKKLLNTIVKKQSTNVDAVSGATYSSNGIIKAVRNALDKAVDDSADKKSKKSTKQKAAASGTLPYPDGVYYGTGEGYAGEITVAIIIRDHTLKAAVITKTVDGDSYIARAESILDAVVTKQSANVDVVSGATYSSKGIIQAIKNALQAAKDAASGNSGSKNPGSSSGGDSSGSGDGSSGDAEEGTVYKNGTYTGSAACVDEEYGDFNYTLEVEITVANDRITAVTIVDKSSEPAWKNNLYYINSAKKGVVAQIIAKGKPEGIDAISGATYSSEAIVAACESALEKAKR